MYLPNLAMVRLVVEMEAHRFPALNPNQMLLDMLPSMSSDRKLKKDFAKDMLYIPHSTFKKNVINF